MLLPHSLRPLQLVLSAILALLLAGGCTPSVPADPLDEIAHEYLLLELGMGLHDPDHVDAFFGPAELQREAQAAGRSLAELDDLAVTLADRIAALPPATAPANTARRRNLAARIEATRARIAINRGEALPFDAESRRIFGVTSPHLDEEHFARILAQVEALVPGDGDLPARVNAFRDRYVIPPEKLAAVMDAAIAECRRRTLRHIQLPQQESFRLEFVTDKPWSGYNWYEGQAHSLIQINTDLPVHIHRAVDLGCHEGYPGHHTFSTLRELELVEERGWIEYSLYPLFSPESLIAEGSGNYGIMLAFPGSERLEFERRELFPLAGIDGAGAERYYRLLELLERLDYAGNEAARAWLDGRMTHDDAVAWLVNYTLATPERARQRLAFFKAYRSYVINYNLGRDLVRRHVERGALDTGERWRRFEALLSAPVLPAELAAE